MTLATTAITVYSDPSQLPPPATRGDRIPCVCAFPCFLGPWRCSGCGRIQAAKVWRFYPGSDHGHLKPLCPHCAEGVDV